MADSQYQAWVEVLPDFSKFSDAVEQGVRSGTSGFAGQVFSGAFLANLAAGLVSNVIDAVGQAIRAGIDYAADSIKLASDLEQAAGAVTAVFKDQADSIFEWSKTSAQAIGLSQRQYQQFATIVGAQLKNLGLPVDQIADRTNDLIVLGADLAAQFGGPTADAVAALSSLLRGERDPIERYGVGIKEVDIQARLAAMGMDKLTGSAEKQARIQATLALLWEQTADAQGTFEREMSTFAGQQAVLNATLEDTQTRLGEYLLPAFTTLVGYANDQLLPRLGAIVETVGPRFAEALEAAAPKVQELLDKVAPLVEQFATAVAEDGIPAFIEAMNDIADAAPGWAEAFNILADPDNPLDDFARWFSSTDPGSLPNTIRKGLKEAELAALEFWEALGVDVSEQKATLEAQIRELGASLPPAIEEGINAEGGFQGVRGALTDRTAEAIRAAGASTRTSGGGSFGKDVIGAITESVNKANPAGIGTNLTDGIANGISAGRSRVVREAQKVAEETIAKVKSTLQIQSPSKVMEELGRFTSEGFALGVESGPIGRVPAPFVPSLESASFASGTAGQAAVYVQNPFTGEYLLAKTADVADARIGAAERVRTVDGWAGD